MKYSYRVGENRGGQILVCVYSEDNNLLFINTKDYLPITRSKHLYEFRSMTSVSSQKKKTNVDLFGKMFAYPRDNVFNVYVKDCSNGTQ